MFSCSELLGQSAGALEGSGALLDALDPLANLVGREADAALGGVDRAGAEELDPPVHTIAAAGNRVHIAIQQILIGRTLYSIINLDENRNSHEMYLYLEEVRKLS